MRTTTRTHSTRTTRTAARTLARVAALSAAGTLSLVLAACGGSNSGSMDHSGMPSESSESSTTSASPSASATSSVDAEHNDQDVMFAQMMIVHHQGALEMAQMATIQASSQQVIDLAAQIKTAQEPEMETMSSWLVAWGAPATDAPSMGAMDGGGDGDMEGLDDSTMGPTPSMTDSSTSSSVSGMPGMMSQEQMTQLQNATGTDFDRMILKLMIEHHTGAVQMAQTEQRQGSNTQALELADSIVTSQNAEIEQMEQMLTTLG